MTPKTMFSMAGMDVEVVRPVGAVNSAHLLAEVRVGRAQGEEADSHGDEEKIDHAASIPLRCRAA
jgi:hypothetical protein